MHISDEQFISILQKAPMAPDYAVSLIIETAKTDDQKQRVIKAIANNPGIPLTKILFDSDSKIKDDWGTCIFEYKTSPSFGYKGMPGGYSVSVYANGSIVERDFWWAIRIPKTETILSNDPDLAKTIKSIIRRHSEQLKTIPNNLNNGTLDGSHECFRFGRKRIGTWTIHRTDPLEVQQSNPSYYEEYQENMLFENLVLDIYDEIATEINKHVSGIHMWVSRKDDHT